MVFDNHKLDHLARNLVKVKQKRDGFCYFQRFTDEQLTVYAQRPLFRQGAKCPAGVYLLFKTNGTKISFECQKEPAWQLIFTLVREMGKVRLIENIKKTRKYSNSGGNLQFPAAFDLYANGQKIASPQLKSGTIEIDLANEAKADVLVKLYLPLLTNAGIRNLTSDGVIQAVPETKAKFYALGDSITQGYTTTNPSTCYVTLVADALHLDGHNQGVGGYHYDAAVLNGFTTLPRPKFITVAYGTNDWFFNPDLNSIRENVRSFYQKLNLLFSDTPIFAITPFWRADMNERQKCGQFLDVIRLIEKEASGYPNLIVIDGLQISPQENSYYADGFLHPNADGFAYIAEKLVPIIAARINA
ncbi:MAG: SGNH/GDSL hydrolase family protein [Anaerolineae bacterium]|nr:SGNH/GDSL hydrolase family protein [Anaerolineae bacterium]